MEAGSSMPLDASKIVTKTCFTGLIVVVLTVVAGAFQLWSVSLPRLPFKKRHVRNFIQITP
jgi:hypothetical protein